MLGNIGNIALAITFTASLAGMVLYSLSATGRTQYLIPARRSTQLALLGIFVACGTLLYAIFNYHFELNYVFEHASRKLSKPLLFSVFYASQEGSFMLWGLWTSLIACFLIGYARRQRYESHVMAIFLSVLVFISMMLIAKSPFETIYSANPGQALKGFIPPDGKGLNPSLQNLWIVIHPPMLFLGFSLLAVPFAFALAGLIKRDYQGWVVTSMPWTLGAAMVLGFGVILGGFWAYETLGWGGFWAWDPVENASLLPWLITVGAVHTMLTQKRTGGLIKTNIAMTLLAYALVLYGSFLTRSGILGDASVHSFADPGYLAFSMLVGALAVFIVVPFGFFFWRWREMSGFSQDYKLSSRETGLSIASALLGASALVVFIGTSAPLVKMKVPMDFYNSLHIPIVVILLVVNGLSLLLKWRQSNWSEVIRKSVTALVAAAVFTGIVLLLGMRDVRFIAVVASAFFALFVNLEIGWKILKGHWGVNFDRSQPTRRDYSRRFGTALGLTLLLGVLGLLLSTAGDYNLFLPMIQQYGAYLAMLFAVLLVAFVAIGYPHFIFDTKFLGAYVAHAGFAVFVIGVIASAGYTQREIIRLPREKQVAAFGGQYKLAYLGYDTAANEHTYWHVRVADKDGRFLAMARPLTFITEQQESAVRNPGIVKFATRDLYFTINSVDMDGGIPKDIFGKMEEKTVLDGKMKVKFIDFDFPSSEKAKMFSKQPFHVKASVEVTPLDQKDAKAIPLTLGVTRNPVTDEAKEDDILVPGTSYHVQLAELKPDMQNPANSKVVLRYFDASQPLPPPTEVITVEAFVKPYINFVWLGIITLVIGFGFAVVRRRREALIAIDRAERAYAKRIGDLHPMRSPDAAILERSWMPKLIRKKKESSGA